MSAISAFIREKDIIFFYAINRKIHCHFLDRFMKIITELGSTSFTIISVLLAYCSNTSAATELIINLAISQAIIHSLKRIVNRPRPYIELEWVNSIKPPKCKYSLPSGHSSSALTMALVFSDFFPSFKLVFLASALLVGMSRIYLGCHYPTDVCAGFAISYIAYRSVMLFSPCIL